MYEELQGSLRMAHVDHFALVRVIEHIVDVGGQVVYAHLVEGELPVLWIVVSVLNMLI